MNKFWIICIKRLETILPPQQISAWIKPLIPVDFDSKKSILRLSAPNKFKLDFVKRNLLHHIEKIALEWYGVPILVLLELKKNSEQVKLKNVIHNEKNISDIDSRIISKINENIIIFNDRNNNINKESNIQLSTLKYEKSRLNSELTFDNYVTGKANQLARAAALQISENPGSLYNPLFLYGGVGLGKTHLIHAIGNAMLNINDNIIVRYVHADQYVSDVVKAYQRKSFDEFKKYYHSLDLLLIDDIQFLSGKNRTQEEFFYAFESISNKKKQIIITSDSFPKELSGIDSRLISRFDSGLTVAIEPPELEMRVAILLHKAKTEEMIINEDIAFFIAKHLRSNIRELEGALRKILAYVRFHGKNILDIDTCKEALRDILSVSNGQITIDNIQKTVADYFKIKITDMSSKRRTSNIVLPRQIAMYLAKELTQKSLPEIGLLFGGRDHTTVLHAVRKIQEVRNKNTELNHILHVLEQTIKG
ncbi:Chromosomal replication initiator protein DnaA [Candidatus Kinetoplastibacterium sorsogonicusi]|uniref:Chromosomal replication initiator protein DnaA n=1 Tax=Candidatus Kinetoplastidibacterium kentomonadis TaxID=1576550 RepID=A0A3S7J901_9PROT|nr:chromosomal replication initiator protein DnaA [Candidatus Kinetoplastibacterium sorsogonicusi]AWD32148.1 Chromosomal replication initiator protein DnaA [Candidatus Kinetoplastibacterium sorsogonicusi]